MKAFKMMWFLLSVFSVYQVQADESGTWLSQALGQDQLICVRASEGDVFTFDVKQNQIVVQATGKEEGEIYSVDHSSIYNDQLKITMSENQDGPLVQDIFVFNLSDVSNLSLHRLPSLQGLDVMHEGYDGTTSRFQLTCSLAHRP